MGNKVQRNRRIDVKPLDAQFSTDKKQQQQQQQTNCAQTPYDYYSRNSSYLTRIFS